MGPPSYMRSIVNQNVVLLHMTIYFVGVSHIITGLLTSGIRTYSGSLECDIWVVILLKCILYFYYKTIASQKVQKIFAFHAFKTATLVEGEPE